MSETKVTNRQLNIADGWIPVVETWTYASAVSFTIAGVDRTAVFTKGTKIRLTNAASVKYFYVASSSFSTDTTVNLIPSDDYSLANSAITLTFYSYQQNPQGFPSRFLFTPVFTGFSADPSNPVEYWCDGGIITIWCNFGVGTSNSATFDFTLPVAEDMDRETSYYPIAAAVHNNSSWQTNAGVLGISAALAKVGLTIPTVSANAYGGFTASGNKSVAAVLTYRF